MKIKQCSNKNCNDPIKLLSEFSKDKNRKDGLYPVCKACIKNYREENKEGISKQKKDNHKKFPWKKTLVHIKQRCENPKDKFYCRYGGRGIKCLITSEELKVLWFRDKAYNMKQPTIDRKKNNGNYEYKNCRFIENRINCCKDSKKVVLQYGLDGKFIREWESQAEVSRKLNINQRNISGVVLGKRKTAGGFIWRYK